MNQSSPTSTRYSGFGGVLSPSSISDDRIMSPSRQRINQLGQRLNSLSAGLEADKSVKNESLDIKTKHLEDKVGKNQSVNDERFRLLKDQVAKLQEGIATEIIAREILDERKTKEIKLVENNINLELNVEKQNKREVEQRIAKKVDEKIYSLRLDIAKEQKSKDDTIDKQIRLINEELGSIQGDLEAEKRAREETSEKLIKRLGEEIINFQETLAGERKVREETENVLFKMLEDIGSKLQGEINTERGSREKAEEQMLRLLEETCARLENNLR